MSEKRQVSTQIAEAARMPLWLEPEDFDDYAGLVQEEEGELCPRCHLWAGRPQSGRFLSGEYVCMECGNKFEVKDV